MSFYKFGFHCTATGDFKGIGNYIRHLRAANKPVTLQSTDSAGIIFEALEAGSHPQDGLVFRRTGGRDPFTNTDLDRLAEQNATYTGDPVEVAENRWQVYVDMWPQELDPARVWTVTINEPSKEPQNYDYLGKFSLRQGQLAVEQNRKVLAFGWSAGTPERSFWESEYVLEYLRLCAKHPNHVGVSLHEYSLEPKSLEALFPDHIGRFQILHEVCDAHGIDYPTIVIGEFGWGENSLKAADAITQLKWAQELYEPYDNIYGAAIWTLGKWHGSIVNDVLKLVEPVTKKAVDYVSTTPVKVKEPVKSPEEEEETTAVPETTPEVPAVDEKKEATEPSQPEVSDPQQSSAPADEATIDVASFMKADPKAWRVVRMNSGSQEDVRDLDLGGGMWVRAKNRNGEWWKLDDNFAYLLHDTSPANDKKGNERVYTLYKDGQVGAPKNPCRMALQSKWQEAAPHLIQFRAKKNGRKLDTDTGEQTNECTLIRHEFNYTFNAYGQNLTLDEVIWLQYGAETQIYAKHDGRVVGWVGWEAPQGKSEIAELYWDRAVLQQEPSTYFDFRSG